MLPLADYTYKVTALVDGWQKDYFVESTSQLTEEQLKDEALKIIEGDSVKLLGYKKIYY